MLAIGILLVLVAGLVIPRVLPVDPARWHQPITATADTDLPGGAIRVVPGDFAKFAKLDETIRTLPRTQAIAGSVADGHVTYQTRSLIFGFPDYTTIELAGDQIRLFARLRIGKSDLGVNRKRLEWLLQP